MSSKPASAITRNQAQLKTPLAKGAAASPAPPPLTVDLQEASSPPRLHTSADAKKDKLQARPVTPMDFFGTAKGNSTARDGKSGVKEARKSVDQRLAVDPAIKGIPQGWDDDLAVPVAKDVDRGVSQVAPNTLHKLGAFKETRTKLSSFSGTMRSGFRDRGAEKDKDEKRPGGLKLHKGSVRSNHRSSSMNTTPLNLGLRPENGPISPGRINGHQLTHSVYSDASFNTQNTVSTEMSIPLIPPSSQAASTECSTADFTHLFTPTSQIEHDYPASITSSHSTQSRDRVMGIVNDPSPVPPAGMKTFNRPNIEEVLPFAAGHPFAAWSAPVADEDQGSGGDLSAEVGRRGSMSLSRLDMLSSKDAVQTESSVSLEGWKETPRPRSGYPGKKVWVDAKGEKSTGVYSVGWERDVLDLEARLHETMYEIAGERHTFSDFAEPPQAVLDIGTGVGHWPISMALQYPNTTFVGLDLVPCQIDLSLLAEAEKRARSTRSGTSAEGMGMWESVEKRVQWQRGNILNELPFDTGVFDLVHIRFVNLGIPETKWYDILEEATRVLKRGGKIEIVETSYTLPSRCPASLKNSFASMLLADTIQPLPSLAMQFNLPSIENLKANAVKPVFHQKWKKNVPGALEDAVLDWVKSAVEYKGTGLVKNQKGLEGVVGRVKAELERSGGGKWDFSTGQSRDSGGKEGAEEDREVNVWAWVATKK
ncbi:hypothetical protein I302_105063 [Kwoniella bestiolae CBS 10118]|uniref:Methyltransferase domain-containing protein n=1 Tax=Kwoniella bestiolae CBS 10118 TaxID=1296100 RepID=A0A1B9FR19_9TREE|nr:hypothetical protein I302_08863 [Kwoniella bestiolae CBS 10118]OCF21192.1 hypothetical protein I302_08863 [Kwoniella bestiolae CBS 10118]